MIPWSVRQTARRLKAGGIVAYPTETVYGLGCDPLDPGAVERLLHLKQRPMAKGLILIGAEPAQLRPYLDLSDPDLLRKLEQPCTPPTSWIVPAADTTPVWLTGHHTSLAVRLTPHPVARALCLAFGGAIVSTSANPAGLPPARSALQVRRYFNGQIDGLLHGDIPAEARPSQIRHIVTDAILRPGNS